MFHHQKGFQVEVTERVLVLRRILIICLIICLPKREPKKRKKIGAYGVVTNGLISTFVNIFLSIRDRLHFGIFFYQRQVNLTKISLPFGDVEPLIMSTTVKKIQLKIFNISNHVYLRICICDFPWMNFKLECFAF